MSRVDDMARLYVEEGMSYAEIGECYDISRQRVHQLLASLGLESHRRQRMLQRIQRLNQAYDRIMEGESTLEEEAVELGYKTDRSLRASLYDLGLRVILNQTPPPHGTYGRYRSRRHGCKCEECKRANRDRVARMKGRVPPEHGHSGYINYRCRCQVCKEGNRAYNRERKALKRGLASSQD